MPSQKLRSRVLRRRGWVGLSPPCYHSCCRDMGKIDMKKVPGFVHNRMGALLGCQRIGAGSWAADIELSFGNSGWRRKERLKDGPWTVKVPKEEIFFLGRGSLSMSENRGEKK